MDALGKYFHFMIIKKQLIEMNLRLLIAQTIFLLLFISCKMPIQKESDFNDDKEMATNKKHVFELGLS